jgi:hypothetical protein
MDDSSQGGPTRRHLARHQWGPSPSGEKRHHSVCRRCGLHEITGWYRLLGGSKVEVVLWVAPSGQVLAAQPILSAPGHPPAGVAELLAHPFVDPSKVEEIAECPGDLAAWEPETLEA